MFCPACGTEYREGFTKCADCDVDLVAEPPPEPSFQKATTVLETSDQALLLVAKGLLESAGIPFSAVGERAQDLFGFGRIGAGFNVAVGPVRIQVPEENAEEALALLEDVGEETTTDDDTDE